MRHFHLVILLSAIFSLAGCGSLMSSAGQGLAKNLGSGIENHNDLKTVEEGSAAFLLMLDGMILGEPENEDLLLAGARLYSTYADIFADQADRAKRLATRGFNYALRGSCQYDVELCQVRSQDYNEFTASLTRYDSEDDLYTLYILASSWASWIQNHKSDWNAVAELSRVKAIMQHIVAIQSGYDSGRAHLYLGVLNGFLPKAMGGKPEQAKRHFEAAIQASQGKDLMAKVLYVQYYARPLFKRELHDKLLNEVLKAETEQPGFTLGNTLAKQQAKALLKSANDYF